MTKHLFSDGIMALPDPNPGSWATLVTLGEGFLKLGRPRMTLFQDATVKKETVDILVLAEICLLSLSMSGSQVQD